MFHYGSFSKHRVGKVLEVKGRWIRYDDQEDGTIPVWLNTDNLNYMAKVKYEKVNE